MKKDIEIAREAKIKDIEEIANYLEINDYEKYGKYKAKIKPCYDENKNSKLVLVTAISPTPFGEGKTTMNVALSMGLNKLGKKIYFCFKRTITGTIFWY